MSMPVPTDCTAESLCASLANVGADMVRLKFGSDIIKIPEIYANLFLMNG